MKKDNNEWRYLMQPPKFDVMSLIIGVTAIGLWILGIIKLLEIVF